MNGSWHTYWRELASGARSAPADRLVLMALAPLAWLYSLALRIRALLYRAGILKTNRLPRPVVSIGNITVGGTGKTPVAAYIARFLIANGYRVAVLSRGYGGSLEGQTCVVSDGTTIMLSAVECGDEPYLLASSIPGLMVIIGTDRYAAGLLAMQQLSPDIFLLDDGYQHLRLHRDLNILLLDFSRPFGNGLTLPAGILREPVTAMGRADLALFTRAPKGALPPVATRNIPSSTAGHTIVDLLPLGGQSPVSCASYIGHRVLAFAGIADPASFFAGLRAAGLNPVQSIALPDHVAYTTDQCQEIVEAARASGATVLITTEKDGVKLKGVLQEFATHTLLARLELTIDDPAPLQGMLTALAQHHHQ